MNIRPVGAATLIATLSALNGSTAFGNSIAVVPGSINMFRDIRAANDVGIAQGDRFQFGADISGGSAGSTLGAVYPPDGFTASQVNCNPLAVNANFCSRSIASTSVLSTMARPTARFQPWTFTFQNGADQLQVAGPDLTGADATVPLPVNVTISGSGLTPTIAWTIPTGFQPNGFRIQVFDRDQIVPGTTQADIVYSNNNVPPGTTSFTFPAGLLRPDGVTPVLQDGGHYTINFQVIETRFDSSTPDPTDHVPFTGNSSILVRSNSFFDFSPLPGGSPPDVALPTIVNGVYNFNVAGVGPSSITFIDPEVAIGYDYAIGSGNPDFASVLLPTGIGDNLFDLFLWNGSAYADSGIDLTGGVQFFFGAGGVDRFEIRGIEPSAGLDPANPTAFVTGLTFVSVGDFTGTMAPLTIGVPSPIDEPPTLPLAVLAFGFSLIAASRRKRP